jgi:hypothetical protein
MALTKAEVDTINDLRRSLAILEERSANTNATLAELKSFRESDKDARDRLIKLEVRLDLLESQRRDSRAIIIAIVVAIVTTILSSAIPKAFDWFSPNRTTASRAS